MRFLFLFLTVPVCLLLQAQPQKISGTLYAEGHPLPGATISAGKETVSTNNQGRFAITVQLPDTLRIRCIGYKPLLLPVTTTAPLIVSLLPDAISLSEVNMVSTGYQRIPKERSTGSFELVDAATLNRQAGPSLLSRLEGSSQLLFDKNPSRPAITVRGLSSINGPKDMLIILDNFPFAGDLNTINPNDIESVTILKDAAAASIWGARAGNGVIVITTKKGSYNRPLSVSLTANMTLVPKPDLFDAPLLTSPGYIEAEQFLFNNGYRFADTARNTRPVFTPVYEILFKQRNGQLSTAAATAQLEELKKIDYRHDFDKYVYRPGIQQQYALGLSGGGAGYAFVLSGGYDAAVSNTDNKTRRLTLRSDNRFTPVKNLQLTAGITYTQTTTRNGKPEYNDITSATGLYPYARLMDDNGQALPIMKGYRQSYKDTAGGGKLLDWNYYPLEDYRHVIITSNDKQLRLSTGMQYQLYRDLSIGLSYQYEWQDAQTRTLRDEGSFYTRDMINRFSQINRSTGVVKYILPRGSILSLSDGVTAVHNARGQFNYSKKWGQHEVSAIAGAEMRTIANNQRSNTVYGYDADHAVAANVDFVNTYPNYVTGALAAITNGQAFRELDNRFVSYYGNAAYTLQRKYTLSISGRKDASNLFGVKTNDRWNPLWSAGAAWQLSAEKFYKIQWLPMLKMRATLGYSGNVDPNRIAVTVLTFFNNAPVTNFPAALIRSYANPELRWEKVRMINYAMDFATRNNRISGSIEYFIKSAKDLLGSSPLDQTTGIGSASLIKNVARMRGQGGELLINGRWIEKKIRWSSQVSVNYYRDKITSYYNSNLTAANFIGNSMSINPLEGKPVYSVMTYYWAGLNGSNGDPQGYINGRPSTDYGLLTGSQLTMNDLEYHGPGRPPLYGFVTNTIGWKGLSLSINIVYQTGHYFKRQGLLYSNLFAGGNGHADFYKRWQKPGDEQWTSVPAMTYPVNTRKENFYWSSSALIEKAGFARLQYINLGYSLPQRWLQKRKINQLELYAVMNKPALLWAANDEGLDPEYPQLRPSKNITFGLRAGF